MRRFFYRKLFASIAAAMLLSGCGARVTKNVFHSPSIGLIGAASQFESPKTFEQQVEIFAEQQIEPLSLRTPEKTPWLISPAEAVQLAVERSKVLQELGGAFLRQVAGVSTIHDPSIAATDRLLGIEAALSAFDAQIASRTFYSKNDFPINNRLLGGGTNFLVQDLITVQNELTKVTANGSELYLRKNTTYDANNAPGNLFSSSWQANLEAGFRHHLGRGGGLDYNRIAGPGAVPGVYNGVLIARVTSDQSILDFEMGLRDLVSDVENAYWDLYFAYRNLEAKIAARDASLKTWRVEKLYREQQSGSGEKEARAREQYYRFEAQVLEALTGREVDGTRTNNGSSGGTFRGTEGVHVAERRLRLLMNLPINDDRMLRPSHDPILVNVLYDWQQIAAESLQLRPELRKQDLQIRRGQLELIASKNSLLPQFDLLSQYRIRGLGHDLWGMSNAPLNNAVASLASGHFQEWQFGVEMSMPVGFRRAYNNMRNAQIKLARDQDLLDQKQRRVIHDLSNAYAAAIRAYEVANVTMNQRIAAHEQLAILQNLEDNKSRVNTNEMLDTQSRVSQADAAFYDALVRYMVALKNIHYEKGTLLEYDNIAFVDRVNPRRQVRDPNFPRKTEPSPQIVPDTLEPMSQDMHPGSNMPYSQPDPTVLPSLPDSTSVTIPPVIVPAQFDGQTRMPSLP